MRRILMDCDPGIDDALAMGLLLGARQQLGAVTASAGNLPQEVTYRNARDLLAVFGRAEIPVYQGAEKPLTRELFTAPEVHGDNGLGNIALPPSQASHRKESAVTAIKEFLREVGEQGEEPAVLLATGPLTNLALLLQEHPGCKQNIHQIVLMGGACNGGNVTPCAEFNIYVDPQAAQIVFASGVPIVMIGLDVTSRTVLFPQELEQMRNMQGRSAKALAAMLEAKAEEPPAFVWYAQAKEEKNKAYIAGVQVHDALAAACLLQPALFHLAPARVEIETRGEFTAGCTVVDLRNPETQANAQVALRADRNAFAALVLDCVSKLP